MKDIITQFLPEILLYFSRGLMIFIIALAVVYIFGRMLGIVKSYKGKNFIAIATMFPLSYFFVLTYQSELTSLEAYWHIMLYGSIGCILFVLIGWRLFDRVDNFLDSKFAHDNGPPKEKRKRKTK